MPSTQSDFDFVRDFIYKNSAFVFEPGKEYLLEARLTTLARSVGLADFAAVIHELWMGRNGMIQAKVSYFDVATKRDIVGRIEQQLAPDGYLFLGAAESMVNVSDKFARLDNDRSGCLRKQ